MTFRTLVVAVVVLLSAVLCPGQIRPTPFTDSQKAARVRLAAVCQQLLAEEPALNQNQRSFVYDRGHPSLQTLTASAGDPSLSYKDDPSLGRCIPAVGYMPAAETQFRLGETARGRELMAASLAGTTPRAGADYFPVIDALVRLGATDQVDKLIAAAMFPRLTPS